MQSPTTIKRARKSMSGIIGSSKRLTLTYVVLIIWIALAIFAILINADLYALATYFASGLPIILGYLWSETARPTPTLSEAAEIVKNIGGKGVVTPIYKPVNPVNPISNIIGNVIKPQPILQQSQSIYSDDSTIEIKVDQNQLKTLLNTGYVDMIADKYLFKKSLLDQIKSLIGGDPTPNI